MSVARNGRCYSTMPDHPISTACFAQYANWDGNLEFVTTSWVWNGETHTASMLVPTVTIPRTPTFTTTRDLDPEASRGLIGVAMQTPIYMVYREGDEDNNDNNNGNSDNANDNGDGDDNENAASGVYQMAGVLGVSLVAGMGMMLAMPW